MKKFITPILVAIIIVMSGYIIFDKYQSVKEDTQNNNQKIGQIALDMNKPSEDLFEKKKECASYQEEITQDISFAYDDSDPVLEEIFYSPKRNSCLYVFRYYWTPECLKLDIDQFLEWKCQIKDQQIVDFFTKETVYDSTTYKNCFERLMDKEGADISICKTVSEKVEELKN